MTRLSERNYQSRDTATTNGEPDMHVYLVLLSVGDNMTRLIL